MKAYLLTTGAVFGLITIAHICRLFVEGRHVAEDPVFLLLTAFSAALCGWAFGLLKVRSRS